MGQSPEVQMQELLNTFPYVLYNFYTRLIDQGFNDEQAMALVMEFMRATILAGAIHGNKQD